MSGCRRGINPSLAIHPTRKILSFEDSEIRAARSRERRLVVAAIMLYLLLVSIRAGAATISGGFRFQSAPRAHAG